MRTPSYLLALLTLPACAGLETGNGSAPPTLVAALTTAPDQPPVDRAGTVFTLATARANIERIDLELPIGTTCVGIAGLVDGSGGGDGAAHSNVCGGGGTSIRLNGPWVVDLLTGAATPAMPPIHVPAGTYRRVDVRFDKADPKDGVVAAGDTLADNTLVATGTAPLGGSSQPFRLALAFTEDARFESASGITIVNDQAASVLLELDASAWFAALPLGQCASDGDLPVEGGVLVLGDGHGACSDIENVIKDAIKASGELRPRG